MDRVGSPLFVWGGGKINGIFGWIDKSATGKALASRGETHTTAGLLEIGLVDLKSKASTDARFTGGDGGVADPEEGLEKGE
jgi:hypothetical protein